MQISMCHNDLWSICLRSIPHFGMDGFKITSTSYVSHYDTKITAPLVGYVHHHLIWNLQLSELAENSHQNRSHSYYKTFHPGWEDSFKGRNLIVLVAFVTLPQQKLNCLKFFLWMQIFPCICFQFQLYCMKFFIWFYLECSQAIFCNLQLNKLI